jgi:RNA polymerase sigma-70 factor (ECF subfamily)
MTSKEYNQSVHEFSDKIYRFVLSNLKDKDKAKDVVQDTFEKLWLKLPTVVFEKVKSYLFTTAYHTLIDILRREKHFTQLENQFTKDMKYENEYSDLQEVLHKAIQKLPDDQRSVLLLRDYEGYTYEEIGEITGLSESQVKVYIYRARKFLKDFVVKMDYII